MHGEYGVFLGLDVGKGEHHAVDLAVDGKRLHDAPLPNIEAKLHTLFDKAGPAHRRIDVLHAILATKTAYQQPETVDARRQAA